MEERRGLTTLSKVRLILSASRREGVKINTCPPFLKDARTSRARLCKGLRARMTRCFNSTGRSSEKIR